LEAQTLARACGNSHLLNLEPEDLVALTIEAAAIPGLPGSRAWWPPARNGRPYGSPGRARARANNPPLDALAEPNGDSVGSGPSLGTLAGAGSPNGEIFGVRGGWHHGRVDVDDLYGLPLDRFVPERTALARELRKAGERERAGEVAALKKPSVAAWAVNQLVRTQRRGLAELLEAGDGLRAAQGDVLAGRGDAQSLRAAVERERLAVDALTDAARGLLGSEGQELSDTMLERVSDTLHAAALDDDARGQVSGGRVERELRHVGLGGLGASGGGSPASRAGKRPAPPKPGSDGKKQRADRERQERERAQARTEARATEREARRRAERAERAAKLALERRDKAAAALTDAESELEAAQAAVSDAQAQLRDAEAAVREASG